MIADFGGWMHQRVLSFSAIMFLWKS